MIDNHRFEINKLKKKIDYKNKRQQDEENSKAKLEKKFNAAKKKFQNAMEDLKSKETRIKKEKINLAQLKDKVNGFRRIDLGGKLAEIKQRFASKIAMKKERLKKLSKLQSI